MQSIQDEFKERIKASRILVVDDTEFNRILLEEVLHSAGFNNTALAVNGQDALEKTSQYLPDLVLLDLMMPVMDGFEYCRQVRKNSAFRAMPIIVQTAMANVDERLEIFRIGATDMALKPVNPDELIARLNIHLATKYFMQGLEEYRERTSAELEMARQMQLQLVPCADTMKMAGARYDMAISAQFTPCSEIGGDMWGMLPIDDHQIGVYGCDFTGHGVGAAINTFRMQTLLDDSSADRENPDQFLTALNNRLCSVMKPGGFATFLYGVIDTKNNEFRYASAGAPSPIICHSDCTSEILDSSGVPLGIMRGQAYPAKKVAFEKGATLLVYSDALIETPVDTEGNFLSEEKIMKVLSNQCQTTSDPETKNANLMKILGDALHGNKPTDDLTMTLYTRAV